MMKEVLQYTNAVVFIEDKEIGNEQNQESIGEGGGVKMTTGVQFVEL